MLHEAHIFLAFFLYNYYYYIGFLEFEQLLLRLSPEQVGVFEQ